MKTCEPLRGLADIEFSPLKIWTQYEKLQRLAGGEDVIPATLELDVFGACNHNCRWCVDPDGSHDGSVMDPLVAQAIMADARKLGVGGLVFKGGGEPALHPDFAEILSDAARAGFEIGLVTNGTNLWKLTDACLNHCAYIRISVDGPTPETRFESHGCDDFQELKRAVRNLMNRRQRRHPVVGLSFCLEYPSLGDIPAAIALGEETGADYVLLRPVFGEEVGYIPRHTPEEAEALRAEIVRQAAMYSGKLLILAGNWKGDAEFETGAKKGGTVSPGKRAALISNLSKRDTLINSRPFNGIEHVTGRCPAAGLLLVITAGMDVYFCCCTRGLPQFRMGALRYGHESGREPFTLCDFFADDSWRSRLERLKRCECLPFCTHPMEQYNKVVGYLAQEPKYHASFV